VFSTTSSILWKRSVYVWEKVFFKDTGEANSASRTELARFIHKCFEKLDEAIMFTLSSMPTGAILQG
jgi:hypothetical protein